MVREMSEGNVSIRFSVQDAAVVRQALADLGKDGEAAMRRLDIAAAQGSAGPSALDRVVGALRQNVVGMALSVGPAGTALVSLGLGGIAAGAGIGALIAVLGKMTDASNALADKAIAIRQFSETVGMSTDQVQALTEAGARLGRSPEQVQQFVERFTTQMVQLQRGAGTLREEILRIPNIGSQLVQQLATARNIADAWNIVSRAYKAANDAGDILARNAITRAIAGQRGGLGTGGILGATADAGGIDALTQKEIAKGSILDPATIQHVADLRKEILQLNEAAFKILTSMFAESMLQGAKRFSSTLVEILAEAAKFQASPSLDKLIEWSKAAPWWVVAIPGIGVALKGFGVAGAALGAAGGQTDDQRQLDTLTTRKSYLQSRIVSEQDPVLVQRLAGALDAVNKQIADLEKKDASRIKVTINALHGSDAAPGVPFPMARPAGDMLGGPAPKKAEAILADLREQAAVLGQAINPTEQFTLKQTELNAAIERIPALAGFAARGLAALRLAQEQTSVSMREKLGIARQDEIQAVRAAELDKQYADGYMRYAGDRATAERLVAKEIKATMEAQQIRIAQFPSLKQMQIASGDVTKTLDKFGTDLSGNVVSGLTDVAFSTDGATAGFKRLETQLARTALQMVIQATIGRTVSTLFQGFFGSIVSPLSGGSAPMSLGNVGGTGIGDLGGPSVGKSGVASSIAAGLGSSRPNPMIFPPTAPAQDQNGGGAPVNVGITFEDHAGVTAEKTSQSRSGNDLQMRVAIRKMVGEDLAGGHHDGAMRRYGLQRQTLRIG